MTHMDVGPAPGMQRWHASASGKMSRTRAASAPSRRIRDSEGFGSLHEELGSSQRAQHAPPQPAAASKQAVSTNGRPPRGSKRTKQQQLHALLLQSALPARASRHLIEASHSGHAEVFAGWQLPRQESADTGSIRQRRHSARHSSCGGSERLYATRARPSLEAAAQIHADRRKLRASRAHSSREVRTHPLSSARRAKYQ